MWEMRKDFCLKILKDRADISLCLCIQRNITLKRMLQKLDIDWIQMDQSNAKFSAVLLRIFVVRKRDIYFFWQPQYLLIKKDTVTPC